MSTTATATKPVLPAIHAFEKALGDAKSAKGRIDAKVGQANLVRASQIKTTGKDLSELDLSSLAETDLKARKRACTVITAYYALERAIAAFRE